MTPLPDVTEDDGAVYDRRPVMFGDRPLLFVLLVVLSPVIVGALFLLA